MEYRYPFEAETKIPGKVAVSEIAEKETREQYAFTARPRFETGQALTPAQRGTVMHQFLQFADFEACEKDIQAEIEQTGCTAFFHPAEAEMLDAEHALAVFPNTAVSRIKASGHSWRERRFLVTLDYGLCTGNEEDADGKSWYRVSATMCLRKTASCHCGLQNGSCTGSGGTPTPLCPSIDDLSRWRWKK